MAWWSWSALVAFFGGMFGAAGIDAVWWFLKNKRPPQCTRCLQGPGVDCSHFTVRSAADAPGDTVV